MMVQSIYALLIAAAAGFSMLIGSAVVLVTKSRNERMLTGALGLAAGVMICVSLTDLLPHASEHLELAMPHTAASIIAIVFLIVGVLISLILDKLVPGHHGDEEGHGHDHHETVYSGESLSEGRKEKLLHIGLVSALAIGLHNLPEGLAIYVSALDSTAVGISIAVAIAFHNIPAGIIISMPVYYATDSRKKAFLYTFLSGLAEPVGAFVAFLMLNQLKSDILLGAVFAAVAGIMLYTSFEELIPSSRGYGHDNIAFWSTILGICLMMIAHIFE